MPGFLQKFAKILPLYYVNEGLRAAMVFEDNMAALRDAAIIGVFAAVVFALGIMATKWKRESDCQAPPTRQPSSPSSSAIPPAPANVIFKGLKKPQPFSSCQRKRRALGSF